MTREVRAPLSGLSQGRASVPPELARYLTRVLRLCVGDTLVVFDAAARLEADATLAPGAAPGELALDVSTPRAAARIARAPRVVLQGLAKGDRVDAVVQDATELGATAIVLVETERAVVRLEGRRRDERTRRLAKIAVEAARQSGRGDAPEILGPLSLDEAALAAPDGARYALDPRAPEPLGATLPARVHEAVTVCVGPEGGLTEGELERLEARGFARVSLGPLVLRTETVVAAVLGAIRVLEG